MNTLLLATALLIGGLLAVQTSVNLQLNKAVGTPYGASTLQLGVATALLAAVALLVGGIGAAGQIGNVTAWHLLGGLASPLYITSGILLFPRLGALASVGLFVTGQMFASLALDLFGLVGIHPRPATVGIMLGAAAVIAGVTTIIRAQRPPTPDTPPPAEPGTAPHSSGSAAVATKIASTPVVAPPSKSTSRAGWIALGLVAGAVLPLQGAVNAALRTDLHAPVIVAMISFIVATLTIAVVLTILRASGRTPAPRLRPLGRMPWWGWLGGACAAAYVTATFMLIPTIGAATTIALTVTGQQLASAVIDHRGLFRMPTRPFTKPRAAGLALLVLGSALVQLS
jgi:bacterial/archaeal transporter family-2 protein